MVLEHARDDLFIEGKSPSYSKIKKPENKQLQLEGTVDITDASDGTGTNAAGLTINGVDPFNPGGSDTHVQFHDSGNFGGSADFTWDGTNLSLTNAPTSNFHVPNKTYVDSTVSGVVAGSNTQIQFNNSGAFGASADLTWDGTDLATTGGFSYDGFTIPSSNRLINKFSTGLVEGGLVSVAAGADIDIAAGKGMIVDNTTDVDIPTFTEVTWGAISGETITSPGNLFTHVYIDTSGNVVQSLVEPTPQLRRQYIYLAKVFTTDGVNTNSVNNQPDVNYNSNSQMIDYWRGLGPVNLSGNVISANGANLKLNKSEGEIHQVGVGYSTSAYKPNIKTISSGTAISFGIAKQDGFVSTSATDIIPGNYDNAGTVTAIPGSSSRATNMRVYLFNSGFISVQYGQQYYTNISDALQGIRTETFVVESNALSNGILIGIISVIKGATDLSNSTEAIFSKASQFGEIGVGAGGSGTTNLQQAYQNSSTPELVVNSTNGAVTIQDNSTPIGANLFEVQDNGSNVRFSVDASYVKLQRLEPITNGSTATLFSNSTGSINLGTSSANIFLGNTSSGYLMINFPTTKFFEPPTLEANTVGDSVSLFDTSTSAAITLGAGLTTGDITLGNASQTGAVEVASELKLTNKGTVTQLTSISTPVTLNKPLGVITTVSSTLASDTSATFTVNNTYCDATSLVTAHIQDYGGTGYPVVNVDNVASGSFDIIVRNVDASNALNAVMGINFLIV